MGMDGWNIQYAQVTRIYMYMYVACWTSEHIALHFVVLAPNHISTVGLQSRKWSKKPRFAFGAYIICIHPCTCIYMYYLFLHIIYRISSKSRRTSKSRCPRNVTASICQLVPIKAALEISPHGLESTAVSVCACAFYVHTNRLIIEAVYIVRACVSISVDAALEI